PTSNRQFQGGFFNWESNFIADARGALIDPSEAKGYGVRQNLFDKGGSNLGGQPTGVPGGAENKADFPYWGPILSDLALRRVHPDVAPGSGHPSIPIRQS